MMCSMCMEAGAFNRDGRYDMARTFHGECEYPESCTCQHHTDDEGVKYLALRKADL